jgi:hypothetical protein
MRNAVTQRVDLQDQPDLEERRRLVRDQIRQIEEARLERLAQGPADGPHAMVRLLACVIGVGIETAPSVVAVADGSDAAVARLAKGDGEDALD